MAYLQHWVHHCWGCVRGVVRLCYKDAHAVCQLHVVVIHVAHKDAQHSLSHSLLLQPVLCSKQQQQEQEQGQGTEAALCVKNDVSD
jgi:hypothetical protein